MPGVDDFVKRYQEMYPETSMRVPGNVFYNGYMATRELLAAIERAIYELKSNAREGVERIVIFMTDGIVDTGDAATDVEKTKWMREELATDAADVALPTGSAADGEVEDYEVLILPPVDLHVEAPLVPSLTSTPPQLASRFSVFSYDGPAPRFV